MSETVRRNVKMPAFFACEENEFDFSKSVTLLSSSSLKISFWKDRCEIACRCHKPINRVVICNSYLVRRLANHLNRFMDHEVCEKTGVTESPVAGARFRKHLYMSVCRVHVVFSTAGFKGRRKAAS